MVLLWYRPDFSIVWSLQRIAIQQRCYFLSFKRCPCTLIQCILRNMIGYFLASFTRTQYILKPLNEIRRIWLLSTKNQWICSPKLHFFNPSPKCHGFANSIVYMIESVYFWNSFPPHSTQIRLMDGALVIYNILSHYYMYCKFTVMYTSNVK